MSQAKTGDTVRVRYTGRLADGTVFDSNQGGDLLEFTLGSGQIIPGFEAAVTGLEQGQKVKTDIPPEKAYGLRDKGKAQRVPRDQLPQNVRLGQPLRIVGGEQELVVWVTELGEDYALLDANHPLAGKTLTFDIELVELLPAS